MKTNVLRSCLSEEQAEHLSRIADRAQVLLDEIGDSPIDHGRQHLDRVELVATVLVEDLMSHEVGNKHGIAPLNAQECFVLLAAVQLHGISIPLSLRPEVNPVSIGGPGKITEDAIHGEGAWTKIDLGVPNSLREEIALVASGACALGTLGATYTSHCVGFNTNVRTALLAALLRVADALDATRRRLVDGSACDWQKRVFYEYVSGFELADGEVRFSFGLPKEDHDAYRDVIPDAIIEFVQKKWGVLSKALSTYDVRVRVPGDRNSHKIYKSRASMMPQEYLERIKNCGIMNMEGPL